MSMKLGRFRFQKKYVAFIVVVPLLMLTSLLQIECPVCQGQGSISSSPAMENVELVQIEEVEAYVLRDVCEMYILFRYDVILTLKNNGPEAAEGWIKMILRDTSKSTPMDIQYITIEIPGETFIESIYTVWFQSGLDLEGMTEIHGEVVTGEIPDVTCNGTGKVSLNSWLVVKGLKESFQETIRTIKEFKPPLYFPPETEGGGFEE